MDALVVSVLCTEDLLYLRDALIIDCPESKKLHDEIIKELTERDGYKLARRN